MRLKVSLVILCCLFPTRVLADPAVTNVTGTLTHDGSITITGTGFGTKNPAAPLWWDNTEGPADGTAVPESGDITGVISSLSAGNKHYHDTAPTSLTQSSGAQNIRYRVTSYRSANAPHGRSTKCITGAHGTEFDCDHLNSGWTAYNGMNVGLVVGGDAPHEYWYIHYYNRLDPLWVQYGDVENYKYINWEFTSPYNMYDAAPTAYEIFQGCSGCVPANRKSPACNAAYVGGAPELRLIAWGSGGCPVLTSPTCGQPVLTLDTTSQPNPVNQWNKNEHLLRWNAASPIFKHIVNNNTIIDIAGSSCALRTTTWANAPAAVTIGGFYKHGTDCLGGNHHLNDEGYRYYDDIYVDNTFSRIVLGNAATYSACTKIEPQIPSAWSATEITATVNLGSFTDDDPAYLYVFDSTNVSQVAGGYSIVTGGCTTNADCADANPCTDDVCTATVCSNPNNTEACEDGYYCTDPDACAGGVCVGGAARTCDDSVACTTDVCNEATDACDSTYGAATVHLNTGDLVMAEAGGTGTAILDCDETAGTTGCCTSLPVDFVTTGATPVLDFTVDVSSPATIVDVDTNLTITYTPVNDTQFEGGAGTFEAINFSLTDDDAVGGGQNYSLGIPSQQTMQIEDNDVEPATPPPAPPFSGLGMIGQFDDLTYQARSDQTYLDFYAARLHWETLETASDTYVWTLLDSVFTNAAAQTNNHLVTLYVNMAGQSADTASPYSWITQAAGDTYATTIGGTAMTLPVPWDAAALALIDDFWTDLAAHTIGGTAVKDRPELAGIRVSFVGIKGLEDQGQMMANDGAYLRATFIAAVLTTIHSVTDSFPGIPVWIEVRTMYDACQPPTCAACDPGCDRLDTAVLDAIAVEFDGDPNPVVGVFAEALYSNVPNPAGQQGINLLHGYSHGMPVMFQARETYSPDALTIDCINFGFTTYHAEYYELYRLNVTETDGTPSSIAGNLEEWQNILNGVSSPGSCTIISTGTGRMDMVPNPTGNLEIFYPTLE